MPIRETINNATGDPAVLSWASDIDPAAVDQAHLTSKVPIVINPVALMPDAHVGAGSTVGSVIATDGAVIPAAVGVDLGCVDADTEYLTPNGWRRMSDYTGGEVMQYHPETGRGEFVSPLAYVRRPQSTFLRFRTKYGVNQMLTPDHRVLCWKITGRDRHHVQQVISAAEFAGHHARLRLGYAAMFETTFEPVLSTSLPLDDAQLRVQVMVMADAHLARGSTAALRFKKVRKIERARKLLDDADIEYSERPPDADGVTTFRFTAPVATKTYAGLWGASLDQLRVMVDECFHWDGNAADRVFFTRSKACADFMHYAMTAVGYRAVMRDDVDASDGGIDYRVFANSNTRVGMKGNPKSEITEVPSPDGLAYCFTVPSGFLVLRRGGNVFMTGNCGMAAVRLDMTEAQLPDDLNAIMPRLSAVVPAGVGRGHDDSYRQMVNVEKALGWTPMIEDRGLMSRAITQCGTLGSGNHFVELCVDETGGVWVVLHSGSRGVGNQLASAHIKEAKGSMADAAAVLGDADLAYLVQGTPEFDAYIRDMLWAQNYAALNRSTMLDAVVREVTAFMDARGLQVQGVDLINCHHNFTQQEVHGGRTVWLTRKGAIQAGVGDRGIIPGSMGTRSYIVRGLGNPLSYNSCSHGAGRRMSRAAAKRAFTEADLTAAMGDRVWNSANASSLVDEIPASYKDIDQVMADQSDLVEVVHTLRQVLNFKGV